MGKMRCNRIIPLLLLSVLGLPLAAQQEDNGVIVDYNSPKKYIVGGVTVEGNNYFGPLGWDGLDYRYAQLTDIPRHVDLYIGDTIVTSGLTTTFPEGIPVGVIENFTCDEGDAFYHIQVRLATDFRRISNVQVIDYKNRDEQEALESSLPM